MSKIISGGTVEYDETEFFLKFLHDLRSGLTVIGGYADIMYEEENLSDEQRDNIAYIKKAYIEMIQMVNDVTDLIRLNTGTIKTIKKDLDLKDLINKEVQELKPLLRDKEISLELNLPPEPMLVTGDDEILIKALEHIFAQIIDVLPMNSIIKISAAVKGKSWIVSFKDNGSGIPREEVPNLFKPFFTSPFLTSLGKKAVGLDLFIAKKMAALHNGKLWAESEAGVGTTICFEIPVKKEITRKKILIIEDNLVISRMWEVKLKKEFEVVLSSSGKDGIEQAKKHQPDLIILDILMPGMDGFEVCKQIKNMPELKDVPVIFLSNIVQERMMDKAKEFGAVDFIAKSTINPTTLANKIRGYLNPKVDGENSI